MGLVFVISYQKLLSDSLGTLSSAASWISIFIPEGHVYSGHLMTLKETPATTEADLLCVIVLLLVGIIVIIAYIRPNFIQIPCI